MSRCTLHIGSALSEFGHGTILLFKKFSSAKLYCRKAQFYYNKAASVDQCNGVKTKYFVTTRAFLKILSLFEFYENFYDN